MSENQYLEPDFKKYRLVEISQTKCKHMANFKKVSNFAKPHVDDSCNHVDLWQKHGLMAPLYFK